MAEREKERDGRDPGAEPVEVEPCVSPAIHQWIVAILMALAKSCNTRNDPNPRRGPPSDRRNGLMRRFCDTMEPADDERHSPSTRPP
jgi:hypothetical protein